MALQHIDTNIPQLKINKFSSLADFQLAQSQNLIGDNEISLVDENVQADWNQTDSTADDYIKNKPMLLQGIQGVQGVQSVQGIQGIQGISGGGSGSQSSEWQTNSSESDYIINNKFSPIYSGANNNPIFCKYKKATISGLSNDKLSTYIADIFLNTGVTFTADQGTQQSVSISNIYFDGVLVIGTLEEDGVCYSYGDNEIKSIYSYPVGTRFLINFDSCAIDFTVTGVTTGTSNMGTSYYWYNVTINDSPDVGDALFNSNISVSYSQTPPTCTKWKFFDSAMIYCGDDIEIDQNSTDMLVPFVPTNPATFNIAIICQMGFFLILKSSNYDVDYSDLNISIDYNSENKYQINGMTPIRTITCNEYDFELNSDPYFCSYFDYLNGAVNYLDNTILSTNMACVFYDIDVKSNGIDYFNTSMTMKAYYAFSNNLKIFNETLSTPHTDIAMFYVSSELYFGQDTILCVPGLVAIEKCNYSNIEIYSQNFRHSIGDYFLSTTAFDDFCANISYEALLQLKSQKLLVPGRKYRIINYETIINPYNLDIMSVGELGTSLLGSALSLNEIEFARVSQDYHQYDIIVTAVSNDELSEDARLARHFNTTYNDYFDNVKIDDWKVKYTIDNDDEHYAWACNYWNGELVSDPTDPNETPMDVLIFNYYKSYNQPSGYTPILILAIDSQTNEITSKIAIVSSSYGVADGSIVYTFTYDENNNPPYTFTQIGTLQNLTRHDGKGVIYYMEDTNGNKIGYDYINIQFKLYEISNLYIDADLDQDGETIRSVEFEPVIVYQENSYQLRCGTYFDILSWVHGLNMFNSDAAFRLVINELNYEWYYTMSRFSSETSPITIKNALDLCHGIEMIYNQTMCMFGIECGFAPKCLPSNVIFIPIKDDDLSIESIPLDAESYFPKNIIFEFGCLYNIIVYSPGELGVTYNFLSRLHYSINNKLNQRIPSIDMSMQNILLGSTNDIFSCIGNIIISEENYNTIGKNVSCIALVDTRGSNPINCTIGNHCNSMCLVAPQEMTIGNNCSDIRTFNNHDWYAHLHNVTIGNNCHNILFMENSIQNVERIRYANNIIIDDNCNNVKCYNGNDDREYRCHDIHIKNTHEHIDNISYSEMFEYLTLDGLPKNDNGNHRHAMISVGVNSDGVATYFVEHDMVAPVMPTTLQDVTYTTDYYGVTVDANGADYMCMSTGNDVTRFSDNVGIQYTINNGDLSRNTYKFKGFSNNIWEPGSNTLTVDYDKTADKLTGYHIFADTYDKNNRKTLQDVATQSGYQDVASYISAYKHKIDNGDFNDDTSEVKFNLYSDVTYNNTTYQLWIARLVEDGQNLYCYGIRKNDSFETVNNAANAFTGNNPVIYEPFIALAPRIPQGTAFNVNQIYSTQNPRTRTLIAIKQQPTP